MSGNLRDASLTMAQRVATTLDALPLEDGDSALARLAKDYAEAIDAVPLVLAGERGETAAAIRAERVTVLDKLGPKLLAALAELGASPRARAAMRAGVGRPAAGGRLAGARAGNAS
jgi:hypothetical protein